MLFLSFRKRTQLVRAARKRGARRAEHIGAPRALLRVEALEDRCLLSVFPVTTVADNVPGSLRQAILDSNANPGADTITFNIGGGGVQTIHPTSALPDITDPVTIDGTTQPGFAGSPLVELNGGSAGSAAGLRITAGSSTVRGLVINGFALDGIVLSGSGGNLIAGNYIGTDAAGTAAVPNGGTGIVVAAPNNTIGGTAPGDRNVISGNGDTGVRLSGAGNVVQGNFIGTDAAGSAALGNQAGVGVGGANNVIGGATAGARNVISGNGLGVAADGDSIVIQGNYIGTDATGTQAVPNEIGILLFSRAFSAVIGGTAPGEGNVISGNVLDGINSSAGNIQIQGNLIGTDATGTAALGNGAAGIDLTAAFNATIGGTTAGARNVVSANGRDGIQIFTVNNTVQGNFIGTDITGRAALGNVGSGILITASGAVLNRIGGTEAGAGNLISGNRGAGVFLRFAQNNRVEGNLIGTDVTGAAALGNQTGVLISGNNNTVGGTAAGAGNTIAFNLGAGVVVQGTGATGNPIRGNAIYSNGALGIDLGGNGVTPNDVGDADNGPNRLQNFPVLSGALAAGGTTQVAGTLNSLPNTTFTLDFYASAAADPSGFGEGARYLGSAVVTTDDSGNANFEVTLAAPTTPGEVVTATATDPGNNTSEFSQAVLVAQQVVIDIKPGDTPNEINLNSNGVLAVAVLTTPDFDATTVNTSDLSRILFGDANGTARVSPVRFALEDVDHDGHLDLVLFFSMQDIRQTGALTADSTLAELTGFTTGGTPFLGIDAVQIVGGGG